MPLLGTVASNRRRGGVSELARPATTPPVTEPSSFDGALTISTGGTYSGLARKVTGTAHAVTITTSQPVIIEDSWIEHERGEGVRCQAQNADFTVRNSVIKANYPTVLDTFKGRHIRSEHSLNFTAENNWFEGGGGIWVLSHKGTASGSCRVRYNQQRNVDGRWSDGTGGYKSGNTTPPNTVSHRWQFFQMSSPVGTMFNMEISYNEVVNTPFESLVEDTIVFYNTLGDSVDRPHVYRNCVWGAYPILASDTGYNGGGILAIDVAAGFDNTGFGNFDLEENRAIGSTNYSMSIPGGHDNKMISNRAVTSRRAEDGTAFQRTSAGVVIWNGSLHEPAGFVGNDIIDGWSRCWQPANTNRNDYWMGGCTGLTDGCCDGTCTRTSGAPSGEVFWQDELDEWWDWYNVTRAGAGVAIGPSGW